MPMRLAAALAAAALALPALAAAPKFHRLEATTFRSVLPPAPGQDRVTLAAYRLAETPVSNGDFLAFVKKNPQWQRGRVVALFADEGYLRHWAGPTSLGEADAQQPVVNVSWFAADAPPADSIYQLSVPLTDQRGAATALDRDRGQPVLISMFYSSCPHTCPLLISAVQQLEQQLPPDRRARLRVMLVSFDPARDTPEKLAATAKAHHAEDPRWTFARADALDVRRLAAVLNIQYRKLADGEFNHSSIITLLDRDGRIVATTSSLLRPDPDFVAKLKAATN